MLPRLLLAATLMSLFALGTAAAQSPENRTNGAQEAAEASEVPKNVVLMIADGAGPATVTMARDFERYRQGEGLLEGPVRLALDSLKVGSIQTYADSSRVTDSAAGATAFSTGHKTTNGSIAVTSSGQPLATLLEAAKERGMATGLVATSRITHATPAAFAAHTPDRGRENEIARQLIAQEVDVLLGGGQRHFLPQSDGGQGGEDGEREDGRNLMDEAAEAGYTVVTGRAGLDSTSALPVLGLFAQSHLPYVIDRDSASAQERQVPTLEAMTEKALRLLSESEKGRENGVFLMVEGSRVDHAGHGNDAATHVREMLAYDRAVARARAFARRDGETLLVSTADHETGGLTLGRDVDGEGVYAWKPGVLEGVSASHGAMISEIVDEGASPTQVLRQRAGIEDLTETERERLSGAVENERYGTLNAIIGEIIGRRAVVGWTTGGHTAVDVGLYASGPGAGRFVGHHDNTYIGTALAELMNFDLERLTAELRERMEEEAAAAEAAGEK